MSNPTFQLAKNKLETHLKVLIAQPIREFQEQWKVKVDNVHVILLDVSDKEEEKQVVSQVIIKLKPE